VGSAGITKSWTGPGVFSLVGVLVSLALLAALAPASSDAAVDGAKILSPRDGAVVGKRAVQVRIKVGPNARSIRVLKGTKPVASKRIRRSRGGIRTVRLRFGVGYQRIVVRTKLRGGGNRFAISHFTVGKRAKGLATLRRVSGPGALNFRLRTTRKLEGIRAELNGRRRTAMFERRGPRLYVAEVGAHHGLRRGRNVLTVTVNHASGSFDVEKLRFRLPKAKPIAGAGFDRRTEIGRALRLDGRGSKSRAKGKRPSFRWKLVGRPAGSKAALANARGAAPRLRPDVPGTYRARLFVGGGASARSAQSDVVEVEALPPTPPIGVRIATIQEDGPAGIRIGDDLYAADNPSSSLCSQKGDKSAGWVQILVLNRKNRTCKAQYNFDFSVDPKKVSDAVDATGFEDLVIVTGGARSQPTLGKDHIDALTKVYKDLGGTLRPFLTRTDRGFGEGRWTIIGSKSVDGAAPEGSASQNQDFFSVGSGSGVNRGSLDGYLQANSEGYFGFAPARFVPFDTDADPHEAGINKIKVGDVTYDSSEAGQPILTGNQAGFQLLVLDQVSLKQVFHETFVTNESDGSQRATGTHSLEPLIDRLKDYTQSQQPVLIILASIGNPAAASSKWVRDFAPELRLFGATRDLIAGLDKKSYALIGGSRLPNADAGSSSNLHLGATSGFGQEASSQLDPKLGARMVGFLSPNRQSQMTPSNRTSSPDLFDMSVLDTVYNTAPAAWPDSSTPGQKAALAFITRKLNARLALNVPGDLRANYVADDSAVNWTNRRDDLAQIQYPQTRAPGFSQAEFDALKTQLDTEFEYVAAVRATIDLYQAVYTTDQIKGQVDLESVAHDIETAIDPPKKAHTSVSMEDITAALFHFAEAAVEEIKYVKFAAPAFGVMEGVSEIVNAIQTTGGTPITVRIQDEEQKLAERLTDAFAAQQTGMEKVGDILVSDWGRLQVAGPKSAGDWKVDTDAMGYIASAATASSSQEFYGAMTPLAFQVYGLGATDGGDPGVTNARDYQCMDYSQNMQKPFRNADDLSQYAVYENWHDSQHKPNVWPHLLATDMDRAIDYSGHATYGGEPKYVPTSTLKKMYTPLDQGGKVGLDRVTFFEQNFDYHVQTCLQHP